MFLQANDDDVNSADIKEWFAPHLRPIVIEAGNCILIHAKPSDNFPPPVPI